MNPEIFTHYRNRLRTKSKRSKRALLKAIIKSKFAAISSSNITIHYAKEIGIQAKVFRANFNQLNKYDYERN